MRIAIAGGGAVGTPTALILARALPDARITLLNRATTAPGLRTFVLLASTQGALADLGVWRLLAGHAHPLEQFELSCAGMFGGASFAAADCDASAIGYSICEPDFIGLMHAELAKMANVRILDATIEQLDPSGEVGWEAGGKRAQASFDLAVIAGLPERLLVSAGFAFSHKVYDQLVSVTSFADPSPGSDSTERLLAGGASILIPNANGYGHVLIGAKGQVEELAALGDADYLALLRARRYTPPPASSVLRSRGSYVPKQRLALRASRGRLCLLGASACSVHPVGAQELNLGLRDAIALAGLITRHAKIDASLAASFARLRSSDRARIARVTDLAGNFIGFDSKLKLAATSLAASALDLCPPARRFALGKAALP